MTPIVGVIFCSSVWETLAVRKRPHVANGGGFVVTDASQRVVFRADGCGILGKRGEIVVRDSDDKAILFIHRQIQVWSTHKRWKGYTFDTEGKQKPVFTLKEPHSVFANSKSRSSGIRIQVDPGAGESNKLSEWEFEVEGSFSNKSCSIIDYKGNTVAQVGVNKVLVGSKDLYNVLVSPGMDQAVVIGVIAVLDYISHESTTC